MGFLKIYTVTKIKIKQKRVELSMLYADPFHEFPETFFAPLAAPKNKKHYARLLLVYYELFNDYFGGVERAAVMNRFEQYWMDISSGEVEEPVKADQLSSEVEDELFALDPRSRAAAALRNLQQSGWLDEEVLPDYSRVINLTVWAKPFLKALYDVSLGLEVEYESHVVGIFSSLCSESAAENGHHAVLNARQHTDALIDSLKLLAQNMRLHLEKLVQREIDIKEILHIHYDIYMDEIVDQAYNRLKTSENLSRYRPRINRAIETFLGDGQWMSTTAARLAVIRGGEAVQAERELKDLLGSIRQDLRNIDPLLQEIDDKNRQYSRLSTEKIKAQLRSDRSLQGKLQEISDALQNGILAPGDLSHGLHRLQLLCRGSLYTGRRTRNENRQISAPETSVPEDDFLEREIILRIRNQLSPEKVAVFLDDGLSREGAGAVRVAAEALAEDVDDYIRLVYAAAYAEGRKGAFRYRVEWHDKVVKRGRFSFREHFFYPYNTTLSAYDKKQDGSHEQMD